MNLQIFTSLPCILNIKILNLISQSLGLIGTLLIYQYGIPNKIDTAGKISMILEQEDENEKRLIIKYKKLGHAGLLMVAFSFFIQIVVGFCDVKPDNCATLKKMSQFSNSSKI